VDLVESLQVPLEHKVLKVRRGLQVFKVVRELKELKELQVLKER
jgi:hypothetical protein